MASAAKFSRYYTYIKPVITNKVVKSSAPYIFSLITIAVLTIFAIRPTISTILNLQKGIEENQKVLNALDQKAQNLIEGKKNLDNLSPEAKAKIEVSVPTKTNIASVIASLQNSSVNHASVSALQIQPLLIIDNTISEQRALLATGEIDFTYNVQGSFAQLLMTLENLKKTPRLLNINSVTMSKQEEATVLSITGKAYYLK